MIPGQRAAQPMVLIADDEEAICFGLSQAVRQRGGVALVVADGLAAVAEFHAHQGMIDAVFLDVRMPRLDGLAALALLRQCEPGVRCCLMTAFDAARLEIQVAGSASILAKPFDLADFVRVLEKLLSAAGERGAHPADAAQPSEGARTRCA